MKKLPRLLNERKKNAQTLTMNLHPYTVAGASSDIILPRERKNEVRNWYLYTIAIKQRDKIMNQLNSDGIGATVYYNPPIHQTPYYKTKKTLTTTAVSYTHLRAHET